MFNGFKINFIHSAVNFVQDVFFAPKILNFRPFTGLDGRPYVKRERLENQDIT